MIRTDKVAGGSNELYMQFTWDNERLDSKMISPPGMEDIDP